MPEEHGVQTRVGGGAPPAPISTMAVGPAADFWAARYGHRLTVLEMDEIKTNLLALARMLREEG